MRSHAFAAVIALVATASSARAAETPATPPTLQPVAPPAAVAPVTQVPVAEGWRLDAVPMGPAPAANGRAAVRGPLTPLAADLVAVVERQRERLVALQAELARATDGVQALAVQRRIEQDKQATEIELLRVQVTHARRAGHAALAARLEAAIAEQLQPPAGREPLPRPAPARDDAR